MGSNKGKVPKGTKIGPFIILDQNLGIGSTGTVKLAIHTETGSAAAVKIVKSSELKLKEEAMKEVALLKQLTHENIVNIRYIHEDKNYIYLFTSFFEQGDLYSYIQREGAFNETTAFSYFRQMVAALEFCHQKNICHHDFKLENCVVNSVRVLNVIDFAYAIEFDSSGEEIRKFNGSPAYCAPEILFRKPHDASVDMWSLGVCLYYMLCGRFPFIEDEQTTTFEELCENVKALRLQFPKHLSPQVMDILSKMLAKKNRITWKEIRTHVWFVNNEALVANQMLIAGTE